ncbi:autotransporter-associated beta strand repeat-containing protein, partial [Runella sp.]|uniref:autotransporter-associated beta strand repeat-containing protein n=1 Tax=Runella sp. TaxID=1960881 RepID=UPI0030196057
FGTGAVSTLTSIIAGTGSITKSGTGTLTLTSANTYSGSTTINGGVIELNRTGGGTIPSTNTVNVNNGGALKVSTDQTLNNVPVANGGTLNVGANLTVSGTLTNHGTINGAGTLIPSGTFTNTGSIAPGNSVGTLSITGNLTLGSGTYNCEINGASSYDVLAVSGNANLTGGSLVVDWGSFTPVDRNIYTIMTYASVTGTFASVTIPPVTGLVFTTNVNASNVTISVAKVLPVELATFSGRANGSLVNLDWATATEKNNAYFSIERSKDGVDFQAIGKVNGAGNSTESRNYRFTDTKPEAGLNFYRLKQLDFDAQFSYSKVVSVMVGKTGNVSLSPVPAQDQLQVNLETAFSNDGTWQLLDYAGRLLQSGTIAAEAYNFTIDVAKLSQGAYILRLIDGQTVVTKQFEK